MKKFLLLLLTVAALAVTASAQGPSQELKLSYNPQTNGVTAEMYITGGELVVAHVGFVYNTYELELITEDYQSIPDTLPQNVTNQNFLNSIVTSGSNMVHITPENTDADSLINKSKGHVMFGWYADLKVEKLDVGTKIATFNFKIKDGYTYDDISSADIIPVPKAQTANITNWQSGIMAADTQGERFYYEPDAGENKINVTVSVTPYNGVLPSTTPATDENQSPATEEKPAISTENNSNVNVPTNNNSANNNSSNNNTLGLKVSAYEDRIRVIWENTNNQNISEYQIAIADSDGYTIKKITGITSITKSYTVKELAHDFEYMVGIAAIKYDGTITPIGKINIKTTKSNNPVAMIYNITYNAGEGKLYGIATEQAMFGSVPTKVPEVYAPEGFVFKGWSVDGKTVINLEETKIFADAVFVAVYEKA